MSKNKKRAPSLPRPGRPKSLEGKNVTVSNIDDLTIETLSGLGEGNLSKGVRIAAKIIRDLQSDASPVREIVEDGKEEK